MTAAMVAAAMAAAGAEAQEPAGTTASAEAGASDLGSYPDEASARSAWRASGLVSGMFARARIAGKPVVISPDGAMTSSPPAAMSGPRIKSPVDAEAQAQAAATPR